MSEIKVNSIKGVGASAAAITVNNTDGSCTANLTNRPNVNIIINGAMQIQQRTAGNYTTTTNGYTGIDRYHVFANPASKLTYEPSTDSPVGFSNSFKITSTSAYTPTSGNYHYFGQRIEGHNWEHLEYGTSNAKTITISFFVKSSITGTWSGVVKNHAQDRSFPWEYTISSADTWEKKTVTVAGCPDGTWNTGTNPSAWIYFCIGSSASGTNYLGSANSWQNTNLIGSTGSNSLVNTNGATWYMTGLKVEEGSVATDFQHRSFGEELKLCERYYQVLVKGNGKYFGGTGCNYQSNQLFLPITFKTEMRTAPTLIFTEGSGYYQLYDSGNTSGINFNRPTSFEYKNTLGGSFYVGSTYISGLTAGNASLWYASNAASLLAFDSEL